MKLSELLGGDISSTGTPRVLPGRSASGRRRAGAREAATVTARTRRKRGRSRSEADRECRRERVPPRTSAAGNAIPDGVDYVTLSKERKKKKCARRRLITDDRCPRTVVDPGRGSPIVRTILIAGRVIRLGGIRSTDWTPYPRRGFHALFARRSCTATGARMLSARQLQRAVPRGATAAAVESARRTLDANKVRPVLDGFRPARLVFRRHRPRPDRPAR